MKNKIFGYARVSSKEQSEERQTAALLAQGIDERDIFIDKQSGKDFDRPQYRALMAQLRDGDTVIITSIDRLGRNYEEIVNQWNYLTNKACVQMKVLDMPILNTTSENSSLDNRFVSNIALQILSYVAEKERENIKERQRQGIALAKQRGKHIGRPRITYPSGFDGIYKYWKSGAITAVAAQKLLGLKKSTFYNLVAKYGDGGDTQTLHE